MTARRHFTLAAVLLAAPVVAGASLALPWWGTALERMILNLLFLACVGWRPQLWLLAPASALTQYSVSLGVVTWSDWAEYAGVYIVAATALPLLAVMLVERGHSSVPWYRRPLERRGLLALSLVVLALGIATLRSPALGARGLRPYALPFLLLCAAQALRPVPCVGGVRRRDALGTRRHWTITLIGSGVLIAYVCAWAWPDVAAWWYYSCTALLPNAILLFVVARAVRPRPRFVPVPVRLAA